MRKRIVANISAILKSFSRDYFYFQWAVALSAIAAAIVMFIMRGNVREFVIAGVCCVAGAVIYIAKAYITLMLFYGLGELIDTNRAILRELGGEVDEESKREKKKAVREHIYDSIEYDTEASLKKSGKLVITDRHLKISSQRIPLSDITAFDSGKAMLSNYGFDEPELNVYHIKTKDNRHFYFSFTEENSEKAFRTDLHEMLTK